MRLGGPVLEPLESPEAWVEALRKRGYTATYFPLDGAAAEADIEAYRKAADNAGIVIAEVGAWSNPLSPDEATRKQALEHCKRQLALADRVGAGCCVNIAGSRGEQWDGPHPDNLTPETMDLIVACVREIIDAVQPMRTAYALETMPWMYPDSPDSYVALIRAIDRTAFAAHLDPVNLVCSPQRYYGNAALIRECFEKLGPHIRSCHAKDIILHPNLTTHLDEARPGLGGLDYATFLREAERLGPDTPVMLEHLEDEASYAAAAAHVRDVARRVGVTLR